MKTAAVQRLFPLVILFACNRQKGNAAGRGQQSITYLGHMMTDLGTVTSGQHVNAI